jgi:predicted enzyme related to lactoylglutathione lyase
MPTLSAVQVRVNDTEDAVSCFGSVFAWEFRHISVPDPAAITEAIQAHDGDVGPPQGAGIFTTRACRDNQGTPFSLWYQPAPEPHT